jgi:hypothetical protein
VELLVDVVKEEVLLQQEIENNNYTYEKKQYDYPLVQHNHDGITAPSIRLCSTHGKGVECQCDRMEPRQPV